MRAPTTKSLRAAFPWLTRGQPTLIRKLARAVHDRGTFEPLINARCPATAHYAHKCYHDPFDGRMWRRTLMMHAINEILEMSGIEPLGEVDMHLGPPYEYCNAGDPYVATIVYSRKSDALLIRSWGDIAERIPEGG